MSKSHTCWSFVTGALGIGFGLLAAPAWGSSPETQAYRVHFGESSLQMFGWSVANVGDINQDEVDDYAIGSPGHAVFTGAVFVHSGADGSLIHEFFGPSGFSFFGWSVAGAGDVNGDTVPDIIVGAPYYFGPDGPLGKATVFSGSTGQVLYGRYGAQGSEAFGFSVDGAGDVDGDGFGDFIVGAPNHGPGWGDSRGRVAVFSGIDGAQVLSWSHPVSNAMLGISVAGIGDVTGDGFDDVLAGAPGKGQAVVIDVHFDDIVHIHNGSINGGFGWSVTNAGDVTGDGLNDYVIGTPSGGVGGRATLFSGGSGAALRQFEGEGASDGAGFAISSAGDSNGYGSNDVLVGVPWNDDGGINSGRIEVRDVVDGGVTRVYYGYQHFTHFGAAVSGLGDVDGDGLNDILVGAPLAGGSERGRAFIFSGAAGSGTIIGDPGAEFDNGGNPPAHVITADLNHDGRADVVSVSRNTGRLIWRYALPGGGLSTQFQQYVGNKPTSLAAADLDHDGDLDLAITLFGEDRVLFMRNPGYGLFTPSGKINVGKKPVSVAAGDLNKDGRPDLAIACQLYDFVAVLRQGATEPTNLASRFKVMGSLDVMETPVQVAIAKFGTDSWPDIAVLNYDHGSLSLLRNSGRFKFKPQRVFSVGSKPMSMAVADFNRDGLMDIAFARKTSSRVSVRFGTANAFQSALHVNFAGDPRSLAAVDLNMDGWRDLVAGNASDASIALMLNAAGSFAAPQMVTAPSGSKIVTAGDVDRDGDPDVIVTGNSITLLTNEWY